MCRTQNVEVLRNLVDSVHDKVEGKLMSSIAVRLVTDTGRDVYHNYKANQVQGRLALSKVHYRATLSPDEQKFYNDHLILSTDTLVSLVLSTSQQSSVQRWHEVRSVRISSSIAHRVVTRQSGYDRLANNMIDHRPFSNASMQYGLQMEGIARKRYSELVS